MRHRGLDADLQTVMSGRKGERERGRKGERRRGREGEDEFRLFSISYRCCPEGESR